MLKSDQNCLMDKCVSMSCNNNSNTSGSSSNSPNEIAKDKILNNSSSNKKKKHKNKNGLVNGCQQDQANTTIIMNEKQQINGLGYNNDRTETKTTKLDGITTDHGRDICNLLGNIVDEPMACCSSEIDQVGCETIINDHQIHNDDIENLTNHFNKVELIVGTKQNDEKRKIPPIKYVQYESELQMPMIMKIIQKDLSEPYSIYTYRYFIHNWPKLCFLAMCEDQCVGAIVCKLDIHRKLIKRGYIAMLAVDQNYRKLGIGSTLVRMAIQEMILGDADEVVLETEVTNKPALQLYEALGFVRDKRLFRYYLNGVDALRLKLWLR